MVSVAVVVAFSIALILGTVSSNTTFYWCSPTNALAPNNAYVANLRTLLATLPLAAAPYRFANLSIGTAPDRVFGLALCRADTNSSTCRSCVATAATDSLNLCPGSLSTAVYYDQCRIRFSDTRFFSTLTADPPDPYFFSLAIVLDPNYFRQQAGQLLSGLSDRAAFGNGTGMYASGSVSYGDGDMLYGVVQCSRDLSRELCARCLEEPITKITCCESSVELTYQGGSCYLRYAFWLFFNASVDAPPLLPRLGMVGNESAELVGSQQPQAGEKNTILVVVGIIVGALLLVLLVLIAIRAKKRKRPRHVLGHRGINQNGNSGLMLGRLTSRKSNFFANSRNSDSGTLDVRKLDLQMIKVATDNFSEAKVFAKGEYGFVYKGDLPGQEFVVKRITAIPRVEVDVIKKQFKSFTKLEHPNLVKLLACHMGEENLLLYEYLPNTSLDKVLFDPKKKVLLDWGRRFKIIQGIAQGLLYLQGDSGMNLIHQNLKASNILLDKQMAPKIAGFCLPKFFTACDSSGSSKGPSSSSSYMAPESITNRIYTSKTDIFSYGVLVLEIITGQKNRVLLGTDKGVTLLNYVWQYWKEDKPVQVLDWSLGELYKKHEVLRCIHVGLLCVQEDPEKRPGIPAIVHMLSSFSFSPPNPSPPATTRAVQSSSAPNDENGSSGHWEWRFLNQGAGVVPR